MTAEPLEDVEAWVEEQWHLDLTLREWWRRLAAAGLAFPTWPVGLGGRGGTPVQARRVASTLARAGAVGPPAGVGQSLGGPTVLAHGTVAQQRSLLPALADGTECWCQLFSEPSAGSDLAGLQTRAERDGEEWVITGEKVWSSGADLSDKGLLLARTDPGVAKHAGISYFVIDMDQPGIEVRPLRQMNGASEFCEVVLTEARASTEGILSGAGEGWKVARTTLSFERSNVARMGVRSGVVAGAGARSGVLDRTVGEIVRTARDAPRGGVSGFVIGLRPLLDLAGKRRVSGDAIARQALSSFRTQTEINRMSALRSRAAIAGGRDASPMASVGKLAMAAIARSSRDLAFDVMGPDGMLDGPDAPMDGAAHRVALASFGASIGGGTDEIQRNLIADRTLGLPREPE